MATPFSTSVIRISSSTQVTIFDPSGVRAIGPPVWRGGMTLVLRNLEIDGWDYQLISSMYYVALTHEINGLIGFTDRKRKIK